MKSADIKVIPGLGVMVCLWACSQNAQPSPQPGPRPKDLGTSQVAATEATSKTPVAEEKAPAPLPADHVRSQSDCPKGMIFVPSGDYAYRGRSFDGAAGPTVARDFDVRPFCIDQLEVDSTTFDLNHGEDTVSYDCKQVADAKTCISADEAERFCRKLSPANRLPSPEEFLRAAQGADGRRFPWGNTWYPWGDDVNAGRPMEIPNGKVFCDFEINESIRSRETVFGRKCRIYENTLDVGPFAVKNLGSNVLEWTSGKYRKASDLFPDGEDRCVLLGLDFTTRTLLGFPANEDLAPQRYVSCDARVPLVQRVSDLIGFRCATSKRSDTRGDAPHSASSSVPSNKQ